MEVASTSPDTGQQVGGARARHLVAQAPSGTTVRVLAGTSLIMRLFSTRARLAALPLAFAAAFPSYSQNALGPVVVTATRTAQPLSELLADVTVVERSRIERSGAVALADLLARLPGVEYQRNGGPGATTGVFVRGGESRFTAVYIDGVRVDSQATGGASWESIPLGQIERIELLRGPAAAVYGSDALSGVIQIFTRRGEAGLAPTLGVGLGSKGGRKLDAGVSGGHGDFDYALGLTDERSDGINARPIATQNPDRDGFRGQSAHARLGLRIGKTQRLEFTHLDSDIDAQYDNGLGKDDHSRHALRTTGLNWQAQWSETWRSRWSASESRDRYETAPSPYLSTTRLRNYLWHNEFRFGEHLFTGDLERKVDHLVNGAIDKGRSQTAVAMGYGFHDRRHAVQLNVRHDDDSEFGGQDTASGAYGYALDAQWRLTVAAATAFRAPTLYQRFSAYGLATLAPERARNLEVGLRYVQNGSSLGLVAFRNRVSNLITFSAPGHCDSSFGCYANTARAAYEGLTLTAARALAGLSVGGSLDIQNPRDLTTGKQLARRSRQHASLAGDARIGAWTLGAEAQFFSKRYDTLANTTVLPGYGLLGLSASTALAQDWTLLVRIDNLADARYQLANSYASAGRSFYAGVKWTPK